ncbi:MAG: hypothetical protein AAF420_12755 [Pseudomonadota bacterium]
MALEIKTPALPLARVTPVKRQVARVDRDTPKQQKDKKDRRGDPHESEIDTFV